MIRAAETNLAMVTDKTVVIPSHGPIGNKSQCARRGIKVIGSYKTQSRKRKTHD